MSENPNAISRHTGSQWPFIPNSTYDSFDVGLPSDCQNHFPWVLWRNRSAWEFMSPWRQLLTNGNCSWSGQSRSDLHVSESLWGIDLQVPSLGLCLIEYLWLASSPPYRMPHSIQVFPGNTSEQITWQEFFMSQGLFLGTCAPHSNAAYHAVHKRWREDGREKERERGERHSGMTWITFACRQEPQTWAGQSMVRRESSL